MEYSSGGGGSSINPRSHSSKQSLILIVTMMIVSLFVAALPSLPHHSDILTLSYIYSHFIYTMHVYTLTHYTHIHSRILAYSLLIRCMFVTLIRLVFPTNQASADFSMDSHSHSQHQQGVAGGRNVRKRIESTTVKHTVVPAYGGHHGLLHDNDFSSVDTSAHVSRAAIDFGGGRGAYTVSSSLQQPVSRYTHASSSREVAMPSFIRHESQLISSRNAVYPRPSEGGHIVHSTKNYVSAVENSVAAGSSITSPPFVNSRAPQNQLLAHPPHQRFGDARSQSQQNVPAISDKTSSRLHSVASFRSKLMGFRQGAADNSGSGVQTDGGRFFNDA